MTFRELTEQILKDCGGIATAAEIQKRCTERGFRKRNGSKIDAKYVAWGVASCPEQFTVLVRLNNKG